MVLGSSAQVLDDRVAQGGGTLELLWRTARMEQAELLREPGLH
jgi:hypothetical protein